MGCSDWKQVGDIIGSKIALGALESVSYLVVKRVTCDPNLKQRIKDLLHDMDGMIDEAALIGEEIKKMETTVMMAMTNILEKRVTPLLEVRCPLLIHKVPQASLR